MTALTSAPRLTVVDAGSGLETAVMAALFAGLGSTVVRVEPPGGRSVVDRYPFCADWQAWSRHARADDLDRIVADADVCLLGGESEPGQHAWRADDLRRRHPRLVVVDVTGWAGADRTAVPAVELLVQARSGLAFEQFPDRPVFHAQRPGTFGAALLGMGGAWAALLERRRSGRGQIVTTSVLQGLALIFPSIWMDAERPDASFDVVQPRGVQQLVFRCADDTWIQIALLVRGALGRLYGVLGIDEDVDENHSGAPNPHGGLKNYYADYDLIAPYVRRRDRAELLAALRAANVATEAVLDPGECWDDEQVRHSGMIVANPDGTRRVGLPVSIGVAGDTGAPPDDSAAATSGFGAADTSTDPPLAGRRVLDFGNFVAGPMAARLLSDLGADVVWVEPVDNPRPVTTWRNVFVSNRGKRSVRVDVKSAAGHEVIDRLCAASDVVSHNFRVGVAARLGVAPADVRRHQPSAITLQTSAYGQTGPRASLSGFDFLFQAMSGLALRAAAPTGEPTLCRSNIVDYFSAIMGAVGVLVALDERAETGRAVEVEVDLLRTSAFLLADVIEHADGTRTSGMQLRDGQTGVHPAERLYRTRDGWVAIAVRSPDMAAGLTRVLDLPGDLGPVASWDDRAESLIAEALEHRPTAQVLVDLDRAGVWAAEAVDGGWSRLRADPSACAAGLVTTAQDDRYGTVEGWFGSLLGFSRSTGAPSMRTAPRPGQHTVEVLTELGFNADEIRALIEAKAVAADDTTR